MIKGLVLYKNNHEGIYLRCLDKTEVDQVLTSFHEKFGIGHRSAHSTANQILHAGYYWPTLFKDAHLHVRTCHICQTTAHREWHAAMPLQPVVEVWPFSQWGLNFIGMINPPSSVGHGYILTTTDYCTRWSKAIACKQCTTEVVIEFIEKHIITRFGCPFSLVCDNGPAFSSLHFSNWAFDYGITLKFSSNYYAQGNGVAESTNKNLLEVIKKLLDKNPRDWHSQLKFALWVDRIWHKAALGTLPYHLIYGVNPIFPIHLSILMLQFMQDYLETNDQLSSRLAQLLHLKEKCDAAIENFAKHQGVVKWWFNKRARVKSFSISDLVLY